MTARKEPRDTMAWLKIAGVAMGLAISGTSLGLCVPGWVTQASADLVHEKLDAKIDALDAKVQQQMIDKFDQIMEELKR